MLAMAQKVYEKFDDHLNPIVVKELRQAARGQFLLAILLLFLVIQLGIVGFPLAGMEHETDFHLGKSIFQTLFGFLLGACMLVIPGYTGYRMSQERTDKDMDLLFVTTLTPNSIVLGKFLASMIVAGLIYSTVLPFMTLTYFLRGIDLPSIMLFFLFGLMGTALAIQISLLGACIPIHNQARVLILLFLVGTLSTLMGGLIGLTEDLMRSGVGARLMDPDTILVLGLWFLLFLLGIFFCHHLSVAFISPPSANRSYPVRRYISVCWLITFGLAVGTALYNHTMSSIELWFGFWILVFSASFFVSTCERDFYGPRVLAEAPKNALRTGAFFLFSGSGGGIVWGLGMSILTFLLGPFGSAALGFTKSYNGPMDEGGIVMGGFLLYSFCYALTAAFLRRIFFKDWTPVENTWSVALVLIVIGFTLAPIVSILLTAGNDSLAGYVLNPFIALAERRLRDGALVFVLSWAGIISVLSFPWIARQFDEFMNRRPSGPKGPVTAA